MKRFISFFIWVPAITIITMFATGIAPYLYTQIYRAEVMAFVRQKGGATNMCEVADTFFFSGCGHIILVLTVISPIVAFILCFLGKLPLSRRVNNEVIKKNT